MNRFTSDMQSIDSQTIYQWSAMAQYLIITISAMAVTSMVTPMVLLLCIPITPIFISMQNKYRSSARELKRLNSIARSPIFRECFSTQSVSVSQLTE